MKLSGPLVLLIALCVLLLLPYFGVQLDGLFRTADPAAGRPALGDLPTDPPRLRAVPEHSSADTRSIDELLKEYPHGQD